ncbi:MAG: acetoacetate--CoA ligase [Actinomycetota bacterium]
MSGNSIDEKIWQPSAESIATSALTTLSKEVSQSIGREIASYDELHRWSIENPGDFWSRVWDDTQIIGDKGKLFYREGKDFISSEFFLDAKLNVAENLLAKGLDSDVAIVSLLEDGQRTEITWKELRRQVAAVRGALLAEGIVAGDHVVAWVPNVSEVIIFALGALSIGAVVSTSSPDFAPSAVLDRFGQIEPKILLAAEKYSYGGKTFECSTKLREIRDSLPTLVKTILIAEKSDEFETFQAWVSPFLDTSLAFDRLPFNHPGFVLFSSGTTGKPKCIVHSGAGILLKTAEEYRYQLGIDSQQKVFFFTTCGWMMWNWLTFVLSTGSTIVLFDGSPIYPNPSRLFDIAESEELNFFGVSAKFIDSSKKFGLHPNKTHNLSKLQTIGSTGSVLSPEAFDFVYEEVKPDVHLVSMSGGTDICGCFLAGIPTQPVFRGELQGPCLGMAMDVYDENGFSAPLDAKGELVCTKPFPSKPLGFFGDDNNEKFRSAYFEGFPGVWTHGDFASKSATGGYTIYGRSDATLNSKGVRIGTAEIYRVVETFPQIQESLAVAQDWDDDTRVLLFVTLKAGAEFTPELSHEIKVALRTQASPRHVPDRILVAPELPRTKSNKLVELAVGDVINGREVRNRGALANPEALDWFKSSVAK